MQYWLLFIIKIRNMCKCSFNFYNKYWLTMLSLETGYYQYHLELEGMALKFHKFRVFLIKTLNLWNFWAVLKPYLDLMMSFKNCIRIRIATVWRPAYYFWRLRRCHVSVNRPSALGGFDLVLKVSIFFG